MLEIGTKAPMFEEQILGCHQGKTASDIPEQ